MNYEFKTMESPVGQLTLVASKNGLIAILWENDSPRRVRLLPMNENTQNELLLEAERQLTEYFAGNRKEFSIPFDFVGTEFQKRVWNALLNIPYGETRSYGQIARQVEYENAVRAVGAAIGRNPISIMAPCHRVLGASGGLTGFAGGLEAKAFLLDLEKGQTKVPGTSQTHRKENDAVLARGS